MSTKSELEFKVIELDRYKYSRPKNYDTMVRPAYQYTSQECKDKTQQELHEFDYLK
jgi:hypothetical protein